MNEYPHNKINPYKTKTMKTAILPLASNRLSIEIFDPKLLRETQLLNTEGLSYEEGEEWIEDDIEIVELSFEEFEQTLN